MSWSYKQHLKIVTRTGERWVQGYIVGPGGAFAVHRPHDHRPDHWVVTHEPSGMAIRCAKTLADARALVDLLSDGPWADDLAAWRTDRPKPASFKALSEALLGLDPEKVWYNPLAPRHAYVEAA